MSVFSVFPKSRTQLQLEEMQSVMLAMQKQINELASRIAKVPTPARSMWERHTKPAWELETITLPQARAVSRKLALIKRAQIGRVTLNLSTADQIVSVYDNAGNPIDALCGRFRDVGLEVLTQAGNIEWELISKSA